MSDLIWPGKLLHEYGSCAHSSIGLSKAHGLTGEVIGHEFFGTETVTEQLLALRGAGCTDSKGRIVVVHTAILLVRHCAISRVKTCDQSLEATRHALGGNLAVVSYCGNEWPTNTDARSLCCTRHVCTKYGCIHTSGSILCNCVACCLVVDFEISIFNWTHCLRSTVRVLPRWRSKWSTHKCMASPNILSVHSAWNEPAACLISSPRVSAYYLRQGWRRPCTHWTTSTLK